MKPAAFIVLLAVLLPGASAWASTLSVVVTVNPLALLIEEVTGERASVHVLVPPGASPHSFEPKPSDLVKVARADVFLSVGGGLDDWSSRLFQTVHGRAKNQTLFGLIGRASAPSPDRDAHDHAHHHDHAHDHGDGGEDPHLWLDPILVADEIVPALVRYLSEVDPSSAAHYRERGAQFSATLAQLDEELRTLLSGEARHYVAFHGAWKHFGARYALEQVAVVQEAPGEAPTPRELANLVRSARRLNLGAILVEPQLDPRIANTLSNEFGGTTVLVDPLGDPGDKARSTYPDLLRFNARAFRHAMALHAKGNSSP